MLEAGFTSSMTKSQPSAPALIPQSRNALMVYGRREPEPTARYSPLAHPLSQARAPWNGWRLRQGSPFDGVILSTPTR